MLLVADSNSCGPRLSQGACGVAVSRLLRMQKAPGSNPGESMFSPSLIDQFSWNYIVSLTCVVNIPAVAQLAERSTVDRAGIEWSLVRFRSAGFFAKIDLLYHLDKKQ